MKTIILAAGEGQRMKSDTPKVLQKILGRFMLSYVIRAAQDAGAKEVITVVGHKAEEITKAIGNKVTFVEQKEQKGTGHGVMCAEGLISPSDQIIVLCGDVPLIKADTLKDLMAYHDKNGNDATVVTAVYEDPTGYGRIILDQNGDLAKIVEHKDATEAERAIKEVNTGIYVFQGKALKKALSMLNNDNAQGEYYLTDTMEIIVNNSMKAGCFKAEDTREFYGVNTKVQLSKATSYMRERINEGHMLEGVTMIDHTQVFIAPDVIIGRDTVIYPGVIIDGATVIGKNCVIGANTKISGSTIDDDVDIEYSVIIDSTVGKGTHVGPFAYMRPNSHVGAHCKIGDFVEIKNSTFGDNSKASHLTYIGDSDIGESVNLGCGTVTVNYDGSKKARTTVKDNVFIGCNANLIAPVTIEEGAYVAAGSTITHDVPSGALSIARKRQINKIDWHK